MLLFLRTDIFISFLKLLEHYLLRKQWKNYQNGSLFKPEKRRFFFSLLIRLLLLIKLLFKSAVLNRTSDLRTDIFIWGSMPRLLGRVLLALEKIIIIKHFSSLKNEDIFLLLISWWFKCTVPLLIKDYEGSPF